MSSDIDSKTHPLLGVEYKHKTKAMMGYIRNVVLDYEHNIKFCVDFNGFYVDHNKVLFYANQKEAVELDEWYEKVNLINLDYLTDHIHRFHKVLSQDRVRKIYGVLNVKIHGNDTASIYYKNHDFREDDVNIDKLLIDYKEKFYSYKSFIKLIKAGEIHV